jgi:hypothetical protein
MLNVAKKKAEVKQGNINGLGDAASLMLYLRMEKEKAANQKATID